MQFYKHAAINYARSQIAYMIRLKRKWFISVSVIGAKQKL